MAFDLVFSPNQHAFTGANHFDHWLIVLKSFKALEGYDRIIIGHDTPVDRSAIDSTMTYIKRAKKGVTTKHMKGTTVVLRGNAGFKNVSTGVYLGTTGWFVTKIEKTYNDRGKRFVSITPSAREDIVKAQLGCYGETP